MGSPPLRIDLLTQIDGVRFQDCYPKRKTVIFSGLQYEFIGYQDLLTNKLSSNRGKDIDDIDNLKKNNAS
jgi:hypothetical protein